MNPPIAKRIDHRREHHGDVFVDPYEWLRDKSDPEVIDYLKAENDYTEQATEALAPLRQKIFDEIKARTKETDLSVPTRRGDWWYYGRSFEGKQYNVHCRCPVSDPEDWSPPVLDEQTEIPGEQVLIDENVEAEGHDFFALGAAGVSLDGNILAYSEDTKGDERYTLRFKDLRTGALYDDQIVGIGAGVTWAADNRTVYYTTVDDAWRPDTVWRHRIGSGLPAERVYHEPDEKFWLAVGRTRSDKYIIIAAGSAVTSEVRYGDATDSQTEFTSVWPRRELVEYSVEHAVVGGEDRFLILHNDGAENFTLVDAPVEDPTTFRTPDRAPRRCAAGLRRRVRGTSGRRLPQRGAAPHPALADLSQRNLRPRRGPHLRLRTDVGGPGGKPELEFTEAADRRHVLRHPGADLRRRPGDG